MKSDIFKTSEAKCRICGKPLTGHTPREGEHKPKPGDISVCGYCGVLSKYGEDFQLLEVTEAELEEIKKNHPDFYAEVTRAQLVIIKYNLLNPQNRDEHLRN